MNVLFIGTTDILGGAAKIAWEIKNSLKAQGDTTTLFVADKRSADSDVHIIPRSAWRKYLGLALATDDLISTDWILDTPEFKAADIIHCHNLHGRFFNLHTLEKMSRQKIVVWTLHDEWALTPHCAYTLQNDKLKHGLYVCPSLDTQPRILWDNTKKLAKEKIAIYNQTKMTIITPCVWLKSRADATPLGKKDIRVIYNGINTDIFIRSQKVEAREKLKLPQDKKIVLFLATAGKENTWKGWKYTEQIIKQYEKRNDVLFLNVGNFVAHQAETNVEYRLHVSDPKELALYYSAADVLLFTSIAENFPLVILEAMSCGLPIVAFDVGGVKEALTHKVDGYIAEYTKVESLMSGLNWALALDETTRENLSLQSSTKIRTKFSLENMTRSYIQLYNELLAKHDK